MAGLTGLEFIYLGNQLGLALAGAAALWGWFFLAKAEKADTDSQQFCYTELAGRLMVPLAIGFVIFVLAWVSYSVADPVSVSSHEGIVIVAEDHQIAKAFSLKGPLATLFALVTAFGYISFKRRGKKFLKHLKHFYAFELLIITFLISFPAWTGFFGAVQTFFVGHNWHSILTVGTVLVVDYLFHYSYRDESLRKVLYPNFDKMSKAIWLGLGVEFISVAFVFHDAIAFTPKFFFMQAVVSIIIINGALLSGPITRRLTVLVKERGGGARGKASKAGKLAGRWNIIAGVSGVISISSWLTITFVDTFKDLSLTTGQFFYCYILLILVALLGYFFIERHPVSVM